MQPGGTASMLSTNGAPPTASSILASAAAAPAGSGPLDTAAAPQEAGSSAPQAEAAGLMDAVIQQAKRVRQLCIC